MSSTAVEMPLLPGKKIFRYYAIRVGNTVILRRVTDKLQVVKSVLLNKKTGFLMTQISYVGGRVVGTIHYTEWHKRGGPGINYGKATKIERSLARALKPFLLPGEEN